MNIEKKKKNNLRNPDIRKHVYKQYTSAIHGRAGGSARVGGDTSVFHGWRICSRSVHSRDSWTLQAMPLICGPFEFITDCHRTRGSSAIVDGLCTNQVRGRVLIVISHENMRLCAFFEQFLDR